MSERIRRDLLLIIQTKEKRESNIALSSKMFICKEASSNDHEQETSSKSLPEGSDKLKLLPNQTVRHQLKGQLSERREPNLHVPKRKDNSPTR